MRTILNGPPLDFLDFLGCHATLTQIQCLASELSKDGASSTKTEPEQFATQKSKKQRMEQTRLIAPGPDDQGVEDVDKGSNPRGRHHGLAQVHRSIVGPEDHRSALPEARESWRQTWDVRQP